MKKTLWTVLLALSLWGCDIKSSGMYLKYESWPILWVFKDKSGKEFKAYRYELIDNLWRTQTPVVFYVAPDAELVGGGLFAEAFEDNMPEEPEAWDRVEVIFWNKTAKNWDTLIIYDGARINNLQPESNLPQSYHLDQ